MDYNFNLSYSMQKKNDKIIKYKTEKDNIKNKLSKNHSLIFFFLISCILFFLSINEISPYLDNYFSFSNQNTSLNLKSYIILFSFAISVIFSYKKYFSLNNLREKQKILDNKYEKLRVNIIDNIEHDFCKCNTWCNCKENYIKKMKEQYNIDLIFK